jgi:5-methylcytosine-specific restriction endonuclease McrA
MGRVYDRKAWERMRRFVLARDRYRCKTLGCDEPTRIVDHVVPLSKGGAPLDPANLVARCAKHNGERSVALAGAGWPNAGVRRKVEEVNGRPRRVWVGALRP